MCFSAQASFTAAILIAVVGVVTLSKAQTKKIQPFAAIPLFFALQQALEGVVWISLTGGEPASKIGVYGYLFFESIFWPIWIPVSLYIMEQRHARRKILLAAFIIGIFVAIVSTFSFIMMGRTAFIIDHHIAYHYLSDPLKINATPHMEYIEGGMLVLYCMATVVSLFSSSVRLVWIFGLFVTVSLIVAQLFYTPVFGSVWCLFTAVGSMLIYNIVAKSAKI